MQKKTNNSSNFIKTAANINTVKDFKGKPILRPAVENSTLILPSHCDLFWGVKNPYSSLNSYRFLIE